MSALAGQKLGKFELFEEIGVGGMGRVYRARHSLIGRDAAVKVLLQRLSNDKEVVSRFFNEARAATMIRHPGIVDIFDFGFAPDGRAFIVMELLEGRSLGQILSAHSKLPADTICRYTRQAAGALSAAHAAGIIHRDLKPDNLFVVPDPEVIGGERVKLLDFGIAKLSGSSAQNVSKTATGAVLGSPLYMSPEQCEGSGSTTYQSDVYSLGCVMYEMAVGRPPFNGNGVGAIIAKHIYEQPTAPKALNPALSDGMNELILGLMAKKPDDRPRSMDAVVRAVDRLSGNAFVDTASNTAKYADVTIPPQPSAMAPTVASVKQTTHGASSGQISRGTTTPRGRMSLIALSLGILVVGAITAVVIAQSSGDEPSETPVAAAPADDDNSAQGEAADIDDAAGTTPGAPEATIGSAEAADEIEITETVTFVLTSEPSGALIRDASRRLLGETPYTLTVDKGLIAEELILTRLGFDDSRLSLIPDRNREEHVVMVAPVATKSTRRKRSSRRSDPKKKKKKKKAGFGETINPLD